MPDEILDGPLNRGVADFHREQLAHHGALVGADIGLLARVELCVREQAVLEIVDAQRRRFTKADGARRAA